MQPPLPVRYTLHIYGVSHKGGCLEPQLLLRFAHKYQVGEHPTLSQPATFSLAGVFSKAGMKVSAASETTLTANQVGFP
jgi:hypothetical protein